jgi:DNA mismatch repair ATPase MutS
MEESLSFYSQKKEKYTRELAMLSQKLKRFAWYRFISFLLIFVPLFVFGTENWITLFLSLFFVILFFWLVATNARLDRRKRKLAVMKKLVVNELLALDHSFSHFENGTEFLNTDHFFSYDLDLFGEGSLFQFVNRTATKSGRKKLAGWFISPPLQKDEILKKQQAIQELSLIPNWRLHFLTNGQLFEETEEMNREMKSWSAMKLTLKNSTGIKWLTRIIPVLTVLSIIPAATGFSNVFLVLMVLVQWVVLGFSGKRVSEYYRFFGQKSQLLAKYMQLLEIIEKREFKAEYLLELQRKVKTPESASVIFRQLKSLVKEFEYRQNILVGFFLNSVFLWDIRCVYKLWKWHGQNHQKLAVWLDVVSEMDALISLSNLAGNHPDFIFPEIHEGGFTIQIRQMGHPLLHPQKRVNNDMEMNGWGKVMIVTGANMAGKSTFLRTVGVNLVLARTGAPVCATEMVFSPVEIYTNMRTTDSLLKDESYFFAELKRIKGVLDKLENGQRIFVILDEMLKGTNSVDKLTGSQELIRRLLELKAVALIATHDLKLSEMEEQFPQQVFNKCFEIRIENDEMIFDYQLTDGVTKTMNATFLMKKMGII